jgi:hypothetical protein
MHPNACPNRRALLSKLQAEIRTVRSRSEDKDFVIDQGFTFEEHRDPKRQNPHILCEGIRRAIENIALCQLHSKKIYELAASKRTLSHSLTKYIGQTKISPIDVPLEITPQMIKPIEHYHYNRAALQLRDAKTYEALQYIKNRNNNFAACYCITTDRLCPHTQSYDTIFSVDTIFYVIDAVIRSLLDSNNKKTHYHIFGLYDETKNKIGNNYTNLDEGEYTIYYKEGKRMLKALAYGNGDWYEHELQFTLQQPYYKFYHNNQVKYLNLYPATSLFRMKGMTYGGFYLLVEDQPQNSIVLYRLPKEIDDNLYTYTTLSNTHYSDYKHLTLQHLIDSKNLQDGVYRQVVGDKVNFISINTIRKQATIYTRNTKHEDLRVIVGVEDLRSMIRLIFELLAKEGNLDVAKINTQILLKALRTYIDPTALECLLHLTKEKMNEYTKLIHNWNDKAALDLTQKYIKTLKSNRPIDKLIRYLKRYKFIFQLIGYCTVNSFLCYCLLTTATTTSIFAVPLLTALGALTCVTTIAPIIYALIRFLFNDGTEELSHYYEDEIILKTIRLKDGKPIVEMTTSKNAISTKFLEHLEAQCIGDYNTTEELILEPDATITLNLPGITTKNQIVNNELGQVANIFKIPNFMCSCKNAVKQRFLRKLNINHENYREPIIYCPCIKNNLTAIFRLVEKTIKPDPVVFDSFKQYLENKYIPEIVDLMNDNLNIRPIHWYNHLEGKKQKLVKKFLEMEDDDFYRHYESVKSAIHVYNSFVKTEKQFIADGMPKNRNICGPMEILKYVMGPVVIDLERICKDKLFGYITFENWEEGENKLLVMRRKGFEYTLQLDGSGFDNTQHQQIKDIIDKPIYKHIVTNEFDKFKLHVPNEVFEYCYDTNKRHVRCEVYDDKNKLTFANVTVSGKTFSGSPDTTLMNTIRMVAYNRFVNEELCNFVPNEDYMLWVKGDDVVSFYKTIDNMDLAHTKYQTVFANKGTNQQQFGLGQIAKFYKKGTFEDIDFCSTNVILTTNGYKMIRKLENIVLKENFSVKAAKYYQSKLELYNKQQIEAANKWVGGENLISNYIRNVHQYNWVLAQFEQMRQASNKTIKETLDTGDEDNDDPYESRYKEYEEHIDDLVRISSKTLTNDDLISWVAGRSSDDTQILNEVMDYMRTHG